MTNPVSAKGTTTPKGKVPEAGLRKTTSALSAKECTLGHTKSKSAKAVLVQGPSPEQAASAAPPDQATSKETEGGATVDQHASAATTDVPNQTASEEAVGDEAEPVGSPLASCAADKESVQGAAAQQSPEQPTGSLSSLELSSGAQVKPATPGRRVERARSGHSQLHLSFCV